MHHPQLTQRLSDLCVKVKKVASGKPGSYYQLNILEQPQDRQKCVAELLDQTAYIYPTNAVHVCNSWFSLTASDHHVLDQECDNEPTILPPGHRCYPQGVCF